MSKPRPYYLAIKISDDSKSEERYLLLTETPCIEPWQEQINRISIDDSRLVIKFSQICSFTYPIYMCSTPSQIMYAIHIWLDGATLANIVLNANELCGNTRATAAIHAKIHTIFEKLIIPKMTPGDDFMINQMYYAYASRRFPITERSSESWKKLFIESHSDMNNYLIKIAKGIILSGGSSENDSYTNIVKPVNADYIKTYGETIEEFLKRIASKKFKPHIMQFLMWIESSFTSFNQIARQKILNMCITLVKTGQIPSNQKKLPYKMIQPRMGEIATSDRSDVINILGFLISSDQSAMFIEFTCALLSCDKYLFILQMPRIMRYLTTCIQKDQRVVPLVAYAMSFAMFYAAQIEATTRTEESSAPFVFLHDSISTFPVFNDISPYVPVGVSDINHNVPFHVPGERRPVAVLDIPNRLNAAMVRKTAHFDMVRDTPWSDCNLLLTGSRYASALWVGPRERAHYDGDYGKYISEHIGNSCDILDEMLSMVDTSGEPLLDILGKNFDSDSKYGHIESAPIEVKSEDIEGNVLVSEFNAIFQPTCATSSDLKCDVREHVVDAVVHPEVRELFCRLKFTKGFNNHSDIDICHVGPEDNFDAATALFVMQLRKFGRAVALRFQKARTYTWVIVTDFLNYTIDMFHNHYGNGVNLVLNYMTSYPRCWFDGISHFGTAEYVCARMSGINSRYIYTMNDPIYTLVKSAYREDISILLNFGEQTLVKKWIAINMPGVKFILGNVSLTNEFFGNKFPVNFVQDNVSKPWIFDTLAMPKSREKLQIWSKENIGNIVDQSTMRIIFGKKIRTARPAVFSNFMIELGQMVNDFHA